MCSVVWCVVWEGVGRVGVGVDGGTVWGGVLEGVDGCWTCK